MAASKKEFRQIPEIDFKVSSTGITVLCQRFYTPRFIQFDVTGRCESCRADSTEIDFLVTIDGVTIYCSRMRQPIFVPFDYKYMVLPNYCLFRVKTRGKIFNIEHGKQPQYDILTVFERQNPIQTQTYVQDQNIIGKIENTHVLEDDKTIKEFVETRETGQQKQGSDMTENLDLKETFGI